MVATSPIFAFYIPDGLLSPLGRLLWVLRACRVGLHGLFSTDYTSQRTGTNDNGDWRSITTNGNADWIDLDEFDDGQTIKGSITKAKAKIGN